MDKDKPADATGKDKLATAEDKDVVTKNKFSQCR